MFAGGPRNLRISTIVYVCKRNKLLSCFPDEEETIFRRCISTRVSNFFPADILFYFTLHRVKLTSFQRWISRVYYRVINEFLVGALINGLNELPLIESIYLNVNFYYTNEALFTTRKIENSTASMFHSVISNDINVHNYYATY